MNLHFDRHLQVLQSSQLVEEIRDLVVDLLCLADDQAEVGSEFLDCTVAPYFVPAIRRDRRGNQLDE